MKKAVTTYFSIASLKLHAGLSVVENVREKERPQTLLQYFNFNYALDFYD